MYRAISRHYIAGQNLVVVTNASNNSLTLNDKTSLLKSFSVPGPAPPTRGVAWMCAAYEDMAEKLNHTFCTFTAMQPYTETWRVGELTLWASQVEYCLSEGVQDFPNMCSLHFR